MSEELQSHPRNGESNVEPLCSSVVTAAVSTSSVQTSARPQDDSVFESSSVQAKNTPAESITSNASDPTNFTMRHKNFAEGHAANNDSSIKNGLTENRPITNARPPASPVKTLIVMAPVMKGMNLQQHVPVQGASMQFAVTRSVLPSSVIESAKASEPEPRSKVPQPPAQKVPRLQTTGVTTSSTSSLTLSDQRAAAPSPLLSPGYSIHDGTPNTPGFATPLDSDPFSCSEQIPVTCKKNHAVLDRRKLGSGQRGKCILFRNEWMTPSEFESTCGLCMSKDWKRSIRYGGYTVQKLINEGYLRPHSAVCTCAVCSDDNTVTCPVKLFQPYKRRKKSAAPYSPIGSPSVMRAASSFDQEVKSATPGIPQRVFFSSPLPTSSSHKSKPINVTPDTDALIRSMIAESDLTEQRMWWQLEEMTKNLVDQAQRLSSAVEDAKAICANRRVTLMQRLASELLGKECVRQMSLPETPRTVYQMQPAPAKRTSEPPQVYDVEAETSPSPKQAAPPPPTDPSAKSTGEKKSVSSAQCDTCGAAAVSKCTGCHKATYCSTACQEKDWLNGHADVCHQAEATSQKTCPQPGARLTPTALPKPGSESTAAPPSTVPTATTLSRT